MSEESEEFLNQFFPGNRWRQRWHARGGTPDARASGWDGPPDCALPRWKGCRGRRARRSRPQFEHSTRGPSRRRPTLLSCRGSARGAVCLVSDAILFGEIAGRLRLDVAPVRAGLMSLRARGMCEIERDHAADAAAVSAASTAFGCDMGLRRHSSRSRAIQRVAGASRVRRGHRRADAPGSRLK